MDPDRRYAFDPAHLARVDEADGSGSYYTFSGLRPRAEGGEPVQPRESREVGRINRDGIVYEPRGIVLVGGAYREESGFSPLVQPAGVMSLRPEDATSPQQQARFTADGWHPRVPVQLQRLSAWQTTPSQALLHLTVGQYHAATQTERLFSEFVLDEYYSLSMDRSAPAVADVVEQTDDRTTAVQLSIRDASGIERVVVAFTTGDGRWQSVALTPVNFAQDGGRWAGNWPASEAYVVQAVDRAGNVTTVDDAGQVRRPCVGWCEGAEAGGGAPSIVWLPVAHR